MKNGCLKGCCTVLFVILLVLTLLVGLFVSTDALIVLAILTFFCGLVAFYKEEDR